jgi:hypothetical protein
MQVAVDKLLLSATVKLDYFFVHNISCYIDPYGVIVVVTRRNDTVQPRDRDIAKLFRDETLVYVSRQSRDETSETETTYRTY